MSLKDAFVEWWRSRKARSSGDDGSKRGVALVRRIAMAFLILAALGVFAWQAHGHEPVKTWIFWRYAAYWIACAYWGAGCLSAGDAVVRRLLPGELPLR